ncbi:SRPBCC family protein [Marinactinospora rubrisoli]|uniref:SRPBCC family protein n=1 Tax=Marinactinospora rubrisoli TaxID=2715399 RepID=A0ABW2KH93_9ACTN
MADQANGPLGRIRERAGRNPATERLMHEFERYAAAKSSKLIGSAADALVRRVDRIGGGGGDAAGALLKGGKKLVEGKPGGLLGVLGGQALKGGVGGVLKRLRGGRGGRRPINIVEDIDIGVPLRTVYDQWTRYGDFSHFAKGVHSVEQTDEISSNWTARIFLSTRSWQARITEQIPDERISWTSEGDKGIVRGAVTFHAITDDLTKVLVVVEYEPKGFVEKTANLWRAQGRRLRLDLKHFRRHMMMRDRDEPVEGWRGEIRDHEVVRSHEDAVAEEERAQEEEYEPAEGEYEEAEEERPRRRVPAARRETAGDAESAEDEYQDADEYEEEGEYEEAGEREEEPAPRRRRAR